MLLLKNILLGKILIANYPGLLQLAFPITFTKYISPLCLPASGETGFVDNSTSAAINVTALDTQGAVA